MQAAADLDSRGFMVIDGFASPAELRNLAAEWHRSANCGMGTQSELRGAHPELLAFKGRLADLLDDIRKSPHSRSRPDPRGMVDGASFFHHFGLGDARSAAAQLANLTGEHRPMPERLIPCTLNGLPPHIDCKDRVSYYGGWTTHALSMYIPIVKAHLNDSNLLVLPFDSLPPAARRTLEHKYARITQPCRIVRANASSSHRSAATCSPLEHAERWDDVHGVPPRDRGLWLAPMTPPEAGATPLDACGVGNFVHDADVREHLIEVRTRPGDLIVFRSDLMHASGPALANERNFRLAVKFSTFPPPQPADTECVDSSAAATAPVGSSSSCSPLDPLLIVWNRLPKSGSTSILSAIEMMRHYNGFQTLSLDDDSVPEAVKPQYAEEPSKAEQEALIAHVLSRSVFAGRRVLFVGHIPWLDFRRGLEPDDASRVAYVSFVREPSAVVGSAFAWIVVMCGCNPSGRTAAWCGTYQKDLSRSRCNQTVHEHFLHLRQAGRSARQVTDGTQEDDVGDVDSFARELAGMYANLARHIAGVSGPTLQLSEASSASAKAASRLQDYNVIGTIEDLDASFTALAAIFPRFFSAPVDARSLAGVPVYNEHRSGTSEPPNASTIATITDAASGRAGSNATEMRAAATHLYRLIRHRLQHQARACAAHLPPLSAEPGSRNSYYQKLMKSTELHERVQRANAAFFHDGLPRLIRLLRRHL